MEYLLTPKHSLNFFGNLNTFDRVIKENLSVFFLNTVYIGLADPLYVI